MRSARRLSTTALLLLGGILSACTGQDEAGVTGDEALVFIGPQIPFLGSMPDAPFTTNFRGIRRIRQHFEEAGVANVIEYREEVGADGEGKFAIETLDLISGPADLELFLIIQDLRQGFSFRYRDFQIRDSQLFRRNYFISIVDDQAVVAGTPCVKIHVRRRHEPVSYYEACVEAETGLVLKWEERAVSDDSLLGCMEYELFRIGTDVSDMDLRDELFQTEVVDMANNPAGQVGFEVLQPATLPAGFQFEEALKLVDDDDRTWVKLIYGDGVERVVYMHRAQDPNDVSGGLVESLTIGPWTAITGYVNGYPLIVMGKVAEEHLLEMVKTAQ